MAEPAAVENAVPITGKVEKKDLVKMSEDIVHMTAGPKAWALVTAIGYVAAAIMLVRTAYDAVVSVFTKKKEA